MYNNQELLKKHTALTISRKDVDTSFIMFPVRIETRFSKSHPVEDISEPDRILYAFQALWHYVECLRVGEDEEIVLRAAKKLMEKVENLDTVYREDRSRLKSLTQKIMEATNPKGELGRIWDRIAQHIPRLATMNIISDNEATEYLRKLDRVGRTIRGMCDNPQFMGKKRLSGKSNYSSSIGIKVARQRMAACLPVLERLLPSDPEKTIVNTFSRITSKQYEKFLRVMSFFDIPYEDINDSYDYAKRNHLTINDKQYGSYEGSLLRALDDDFRKYSVYRARYLGGEAITRDEKGNDKVINIRKRRVSLCDKMKSKIGKYEHYTLFAEKMILWSLRLATTKKDVATVSIAEKWRRIAGNTMFSYHEEREWLLSVLKVYNDYKGETDYVHRIAAAKINSHNKYIHNRKLSYKKNMKCLLVRIYPDEIAVTQMEKGLSRNEIINAREFWLKYLNSSSEIEQKAAWTSLCSVYNPPRAAFIARSQYPHKIGELLRYLRNSGSIPTLYPNKTLDKFFPAVEAIRESDEELFTIPMSELMPDRFVLQADLNNGGKKGKTIIQYGRLIPKSIQVGLDLNRQTDAHESSEGLKLEGNLRWLTDYDAAERMGMAVTVPLDPYKFDHYTKNQKKKAKEENRKLPNKIRSFIFDSIYVMGMKEMSHDNEEDSVMCSSLIQDIMNAHLYNEEGLDLLKIGTPTNILTDEDSEDNSRYDTSKDAQIEDYYNKSIKPLKEGVKNGPIDGDASLLSKLFCFGERRIRYFDNPFLNVAGRDNVEMYKEYLVSIAFLKALAESNHPIIKLISKNSILTPYFEKSVSPIGVFPPLRIGNQPYGIVPVCDFKNLKYRKGDPLYLVKEILMFLTDKWNDIAKKYVISEDNMYTKGKTEERYLNVVGATPTSSSFYKRTRISEPDLLLPNYFKLTKNGSRALRDLLSIVSNLYPSTVYSDFVKTYFPDFKKIPLSDPSRTELIKDEDGNEKFGLETLKQAVKAKMTSYSLGLMTEKELDELITGMYDLFSYRLDAWLTGLLHKRLRERMYLKKTHKISIGAYGWVFNLKEKNTKSTTDEFILAPSINQAITASVLRSSFTRTSENSRKDYSMSVNLSSVRVRKALKIIQGIRNGLSLGAVLGSELERMLHEEYKKSSRLEMDYFIYYLRKAYPLNSYSPADAVDASTNANSDKGFRDVSIDVLNGVALIEDLRNIDPAKENIDQQKFQLTELYNLSSVNDSKERYEKWLCKLFGKSINEVKNLFKLSDGRNLYDQKVLRLMNLIQQMEDSYDALADVITSESVYKLTEGNRVAVDALMGSLQSGRNIPSPDVTEIPLDSAHIEERVFAALDTEAVASSKESVMQVAEPSLDKWMGENLGFGQLVYQYVDNGAAVNVSLSSIGVTPSELVYLSTDWDKFRDFLSVLNWCGNGTSASGTEDCIFLDEAELAVDSMREMIYRSRALKEDDLIAGSPEEEMKSDKNEIQKRYESARRMVSALISDLDKKAAQATAYFEANPSMPLPDSNLKEVVSLLVRCFRCGLVDALSGIDKSLLLEKDDRYSHPTEFAELLKVQYDLVSKMAHQAAILAERMDKAEATRKGPKGKENNVEEAAKDLLVAPFLMIQHIKMQGAKYFDVDKMGAQLSGEKPFINVSDSGLEQNMIGLSDVRPQLASLHQIRMFGKWNFLETGKLAAMQTETTEKPDDNWLGAEVRSEESVRDANVYTVLNPSQFIVKKNGKDYRDAAGLMIDFWVERIPYRRQTAALAFGYDQPDAEPPQSVLVGVSTIAGNHHWSQKRMVRTIRSAMHQVKTRAVEPDHIAAYSWTSGIFPLLDVSPEKDGKK